MRTLLIRCAGFLIGLLLLPAIAAPIPDKIEAQYSIYKDTLPVATTTETFERTGEQYRIESISRATGLLALIKPETIHITSIGKITSGGLQPVEFSSVRLLDIDLNARAEMDWRTLRIRFDDRNGQREAPLPERSQDRLSAMYQFMFAPLQDHEELDFFMTNGSKIEPYHYLVESGRSVTVPAGTFATLYLTNTPQENENKTEIWLMQEQFNLPCKVIITDAEGSQFIQVLTQLRKEP